MPRISLLGLPLLLVLLAFACATPPSATVPAAQLLSLAEPLPGIVLFVKDGNIWLLSDDRSRQLTAGGTWRQPQWSPDGSEVAYVYRSTNFSEIFLMNADGTNNRRLTGSQSSSLSDNDWAFRPTWSPSGTQIAFVSDSDSYNPTLWIMNKDGSGKRQLLGPGAFLDAADGLSWSPDGKRLAITAFGTEVSQILLLELGRTTAQPVTDNPRGALDPAWSPDGSMLAFASRNGNRTDIRLRRLDGSAEIEVTGGALARSPTWSPDGKHLAYLSAKPGSFEVYAVDVAVAPDLSVSNERQLTHDLNVDATSGLSWGK